MYHQLKDGDQFSDEEEYGGNDVVEINDAVDSFSADTKFLICQSKVVSTFNSLFEDVCGAVGHLRISMIFLTFHKHQRLDGKLERGKPGVRTTNQKVLRQAACSVGIFVDRGQTGFQIPSPDHVQNVDVIFFGGPDDREAVACSKRMATHQFVRKTLVRFLPAEEDAEAAEKGEYEGRSSSQRSQEEEVLMEMPEVEGEMDNACINDFYNRYVAEGKVEYEEIEGMYSLFIVGKRGGGGSSSLAAMTRDMSDWEECPELGTVGDLLASTEITSINASVLVIQQYRRSPSQIRD